MGATFSRIKTWNPEVLTNEDLNAEIDNILNNLGPLGIDDYSTNTALMQTQTDPGEVGSESLATSLAAELARLRFAIAEIKGETYWYTSADSSISELASALGGGIESNRVASGRVRTLPASSQPIYLKPAGSGNGRTVTLDGTPTSFVYFIEGVQYTISTDVTSGTLTAAPASNNTALVNDAALTSDFEYSKLLGEFGTAIMIDNIGTEISGLSGKLAAFSITNGVDTEYFIGRVGTDRITECKRGYFFSSTDTPFPRIAFSDNDTITLMKLTWVFANTLGTLAVTYNNPVVSSDEPTSPAIGDYWFDLVNDKWRIYNSSTFVDADATLVGICFQSTADTLGARSVDFFRAYEPTNTLEVQRNSNTQIWAKERFGELNVYGSGVRFKVDRPVWDITADLDSGLVEAASTMYYLYIKENGDRLISDQHPLDRTQDLKGLYHPHQAWRCVGSFFNDASSNIEAVIDYSDLDARNFAISTAVAASALTFYVHTNPLVKYKTKSATAASGAVTQMQIAGLRTLTVPSTATLGHTSAFDHYIFPYFLLQGQNPELAIASRFHDDGQIVSTTLLNTGSDTANIYSLAARTSVPVLRFGRMLSNQTTAGTWAAVPTEVKTLGSDAQQFCKVTTNTATNISNGATATLDMSTVVYDPYGMADTANDAIDFSIAGYYSVSWMVNLSTNATTVNARLRSLIRLNGTTIIGVNNSQFADASGFAGTGSGTGGSFIYYFDSGDTITLEVSNGDSVAHAVQAGADNTWMQALRIPMLA